MKFSVITVCRNAAPTIRRALASVQDQNWPEFESIVIDGLSTDRTVEFAKGILRAGDQIVSERDTGLYNAMNKGIARATGDIIAFLNADDWYPRQTVLSEVAEIFGSGNLDAVLGDVAFFDAEAPERMVRRYRSDRFRPWKLRFGIMPAHPATFVRRDVFRTVGNFAEDFRIAADYEMAVRMFLKARISYAHLPQVLVHMQTGGVSTAGWHAAMTINRESVRACRSNGIYSNLAMIGMKYPYKIAEFVR